MQKNNIDAKSCFRVSKKDGKLSGHPNYISDYIYYTEQEIIEECWVRENRYSIVSAVQGCNDYTTLKNLYDILKIVPESKS
jgi:hypothetical protein